MRIGALLLALVGFVAAWTGNLLDGTEGSSSAQDPAELQTALESALLSLEDMPAGWEVMPPDPGSGEAACGLAQLDAIGAPEAEVESGFLYSGFGPMVQHSITAFAPAVADERWDAMEELLLSCESYTSGEKDVTFSLSPLPFPAIGDESFALRATAPAGAFGEATADYVYVRSGNLVMLVGHLVVGTESIDPVQTEQFVRRANEKLGIALH